MDVQPCIDRADMLFNDKLITRAEVRAVQEIFQAARDALLDWLGQRWVQVGQQDLPESKRKSLQALLHTMRATVPNMDDDVLYVGGILELYQGQIYTIRTAAAQKDFSDYATTASGTLVHIRTGWMPLFVEKFPFAVFNALLNELAHAMDPEVYNPLRVPDYPFAPVLSCLEDTRSVGALPIDFECLEAVVADVGMPWSTRAKAALDAVKKNPYTQFTLPLPPQIGVDVYACQPSQHTEAFSDWLATEVTMHALASPGLLKAAPQLQKAIAEDPIDAMALSFGKRCDEQTDAGAPPDPHVSAATLIERMFYAHPNVQRLLPCTTERCPEQPLYCGFANQVP